MADTDDSKARKKTSAEDEPSAAPETKGAGAKLDDEVVKESYEGTDDADDGEGADPKTDAAVDDVMKKEGDEALKAQDEKAVVTKTGPWVRFKNFVAEWWGNPRKRWITIGAVVAILAIVGGVPYTRYTVAGVVLKGKVTVQVVDSKTGQPVSGATVALGGKTTETDVSGKATLQVNTGSKELIVSKKYYGGVTQRELVPLSNSMRTVKLVALGHQVNIKVVNKLTGKPVANAVVAVQGGNTKTKTDGTATVVLPSGVTTQEASVSLSGYNTTKVNIDALGDLTKNTFDVVPAGKLYFLSNLSGSIDVVKTDLDGSNRKTVLVGTGSEDKYSTSLLASRDWKYLALLSKRSGDNASVYLIDTTQGDKLSTIDEGNANFSLVGWSGDQLVYKVDRSATVLDWQPHQQALKSFDATTSHTLLLDQTDGAGVGTYAYAKQYFGGVYLIGDQVVYVKNWQGQGTPLWTPLIPANQLMHGRQASLETIGADGSGHKTLKSLALDSCNDLSVYCHNTNISLGVRLYEPEGLYLYFRNDSTDIFFDYDNGKVTDDTALTSDKFYNTPYPTYLLSPSSNGTFWSDSRDGKNVLFTGDADGKSPKQIASLSEYNTYGWYTDNYLLVSKSSSEVYIMPASGGTPFKITDYYKPATDYQGYGGGYGGL